MWEVYCETSSFNDVSAAFEEAGLTPESAEIVKLPSTTVEISNPGEASKVMALMEALDDVDDVQSVYANFDIDDETMASLDD